MKWCISNVYIYQIYSETFYGIMRAHSCHKRFDRLWAVHEAIKVKFVILCWVRLQIKHKLLNNLRKALLGVKRTKATLYFYFLQREIAAFKPRQWEINHILLTSVNTFSSPFFCIFLCYILRLPTVNCFNNESNKNKLINFYYDSKMKS